MADKSDSLGIETKPPFPIKGATTEHTLEFADRKLNYRAVAEWIPLRKIYKPIGYVFHTAYLVDSPVGVARPLTFVFNGGPGAASAYLHMGALGPQRVAFGSMGTLPPAANARRRQSGNLADVYRSSVY